MAKLAIELGVEKIRLTGGEPLVRQDLPLLIEKLAALEGLHDICLTTNGALLGERVQALKQAGLRRVNISIDTLDAEKFKQMTKRGDLGQGARRNFCREGCRLGADQIKRRRRARRQ